MNQSIDAQTEGAKTTVKLSLTERLLAKTKEYDAPEEEVLTVTIRDIKGTKDPKRVMMVTDRGNMFAFTNTFDGGVPIGAKEFKADVTLREAKDAKGVEHINIVRVKYDLESTGKYSFVATHKLAVTL